jgi:hypothetical protein
MRPMTPRSPQLVKNTRRIVAGIGYQNDTVATHGPVARVYRYLPRLFWPVGDAVASRDQLGKLNGFRDHLSRSAPPRSRQRESRKQ